MDGEDNMKREAEKYKYQRGYTTKLIVFFIACVSLTLSGCAKKKATSTTDNLNFQVKPTELEAIATGELIKRLTDVCDFGTGFHPTAWADAFIAVDDSAQFEGGIIGSEEPKVSMVMRELVRRGTKALPELINNLSNAAETKVTVKHESNFGGMWHSNEYDPRNEESILIASEPNQKHISEYTLKVGDLCLVAIGQIVNRNLFALRYQPTECLIINSPVQMPSLMEEVKKDWSGLTDEQFKQSLQEDLKSNNPWRLKGAAKRLKFYYNITVR